MARTLTQREARERVVTYLGATTIAKLKVLAEERDDNVSGVIRFIIAEWFRAQVAATRSVIQRLDAGPAIPLDQQIGREAHQLGG